ncbi:transporter substrate-binding domain-containing protein [Haloarchaeobius salinus]|uniref:transporter substrate-binding domain-containing protein n=1 Tax=Haloarchaeobius salinus TaxID=1198298 RepID=UPI00210E6B02|nr:transporter substrate-binding domain-containing protein [Haloarchaeobius salinus]
MDRRSYLKATGAAVTTVSLAGCIDSLTGGGGGGENTIIPGTASGFPPFEMKEGDEVVGFDIDLLEAVVDETDYELAAWEDLNSFDSLIPSLRNGNIDVIAAAMTITEDRDENIDFSDPYYSANQSILVREGGDFQPSELSDLQGRQVGSQAGTTGESVIQGMIEDGDFQESNYNAYDTYVLAVTDLENGNIDAVVLDEPVAASFASERSVSVAFVYETGEQYGFGIRTGESELQSALNDGLATVREDGTYQDLTAEWFGE